MLAIARREARRLTQHRQDREDIAQGAFLAAWQAACDESIPLDRRGAYAATRARWGAIDAARALWGRGAVRPQPLTAADLDSLADDRRVERQRRHRYRRQG